MRGLERWVARTGFEPCTIRSLEVGGLAGSATRTPCAQAPNTEPRPSEPDRGGCPVGNCAASASTGSTRHHGAAGRAKEGSMTETAYAMDVGIDWGTASHQVAV